LRNLRKVDTYLADASVPGPYILVVRVDGPLDPGGHRRGPHADLLLYVIDRFFLFLDFVLIDLLGTAAITLLQFVFEFGDRVALTRLRAQRCAARVRCEFRVLAPWLLSLGSGHNPVAEL